VTVVEKIRTAGLRTTIALMPTGILHSNLANHYLPYWPAIGQDDPHLSKCEEGSRSGQSPDHLVSKREQCRGNGKSEGLGRLEMLAVRTRTRVCHTFLAKALVPKGFIEPKEQILAPTTKGANPRHYRKN
jgi:hypothetical protein